MSSLSLSGSGLCHACPQFVLALFNFTRQLAVFWPKVCHACQQSCSFSAQGSFSTLSDVFEFKAFCKVLLLRHETLSSVPGHTVDSLGGTPATFMVEA